MGVFENPQVRAGNICHRASRCGIEGVLDCRRRRFGRGRCAVRRWSRKSRTFRQAAAHRWNFCPAGSCPALKSLTEIRLTNGVTDDGRSLPAIGRCSRRSRRRERSFERFFRWILDVEHCDIVVAPPFTALAAASRSCGTRVAISAQDVYWENEGAFTGEISVPMLLDAGCTYTIIGHSERRQFFGETDETVNRKTRAAIAGRAATRLSAWEKLLTERDAGKAAEVVRRQVRKGLAQLTESDLSPIIVAYEPVWAIGTGRTATPEIAAEMHGEIRKTIRRNLGIEGCRRAFVFCMAEASSRTIFRH